MQNYRGRRFFTTVIVLIGIQSFLVLADDFQSNDKKIIYLISTPRSLSTAFLRMMHARGDCIVMNEPSILPQSVRLWRDMYFSGLKRYVLWEAENKHVFAKELAYHITQHIYQDIDFIKNPNVYFVFLIRNPHHSVLSLYKKLKRYVKSCDISLFDQMGYKELYTIFQYVKQYSVHPCYIVLTEDLYTNSEKIIYELSKHLDIDYKLESLHWDNLGEDFNGKEEWSEKKPKQFVYHWHSDAIKSTGFKTPSMYEVNADGIPTFSEAADSDEQAVCKNAYAKQLPYYELLLQEYSKQQQLMVQ